MCPVFFSSTLIVFTLIVLIFQLITMVQTIKDMAKGFFHGKLIDLVDEELVSN